MDCETKFTFQYPPAKDEKILTARIISTDARRQSPWGDQVKICSKCGNQNAFDASECSQCQVVFEKLRDLPTLGSARFSPKLIKAWTQLIHDFAIETAHLDFIKLCEMEGALSFAELRYKQYLEVQSFDETAQAHLELVRMRQNLEAQKKPEKAIVSKDLFRRMFEKIEPETVDWKKLATRLSPLFFGLLLVVFGFTLGQFRNLVGVGVAFLILWVGFSLYFGNFVSRLPRK